MTPAPTALRTAAALVRPLPRVVFRLSGDRALAYLQDVLAQDVSGLGPGRGALAAALSPKGRVSAEVRVLPLLGGAVLLDGEPEAAGGIEERIGRHAGLAGCELVETALAVAALRGPLAERALTDAGLPVPPAGEASFVEREGFVVVRVVWGVGGFDLIGDAPSIDAPAASFEDLEAARIDAGRPRFGRDVTEDLLVNETPLLERAVASDKGCYPGQESVAKVRNLGGVRRLIRGLRSAEARLDAGVEVLANGGVVGTVTSAAGTAAIAVLRSDIEPGTDVDAGGVLATVTAIS